MNSKEWWVESIIMRSMLRNELCDFITWARYLLGIDSLCWEKYFRWFSAQTGFKILFDSLLGIILLWIWFSLSQYVMKSIYPNQAKQIDQILDCLLYQHMNYHYQKSTAAVKLPERKLALTLFWCLNVQVQWRLNF